jgi:CDP-diacylglycerol--glycerol-3-phosphate 3-phosphatidyltransferase
MAEINAGELAAWLSLAAIALAMLVFAVRAHTRPIDPNVAGRPTTILLSYRARDFFVWMITPIERVLIRRQVSPDVLNYLVGVFGLAAGVAFAFNALPLAAWCVGLSGICDVLDGRIARARGLSSAYGDFVDSVLDRFSETFTFVGIAWYVSGTPRMAAATALALGGSLLVSYTRAFGEIHGVSFGGGIAQRAERLVLIAFAALLDAPVARWLGWPPGRLVKVAVVAIACATLATAIYRTIVVARRLAQRDGKTAAARPEAVTPESESERAGPP